MAEWMVGAGKNVRAKSCGLAYTSQLLPEHAIADNLPVTPRLGFPWHVLWKRGWDRNSIEIWTPPNRTMKIPKFGRKMLASIKPWDVMISQMAKCLDEQVSIHAGTFQIGSGFKLAAIEFRVSEYSDERGTPFAENNQNGRRTLLYARRKWNTATGN